MNSMVQKQGWGIAISHLIIWIGIFIVIFPIYLAFVTSTHSQEALVVPPLPLLPGDHLLANYAEAWSSGTHVPVWRMLLNSTIMALGITIGKIIISLLSAFAIVYFNFRFKLLFSG